MHCFIFILNHVLLYFTFEFYDQSHTLVYTQEVSDTIFNLIIPFFRIMVMTIL